MTFNFKSNNTNPNIQNALNDLNQNLDLTNRKNFQYIQYFPKELGLTLKYCYELNSPELTIEESDTLEEILLTTQNLLELGTDLTNILNHLHLKYLNIQNDNVTVYLSVDPLNYLQLRLDIKLKPTVNLEFKSPNIQGYNYYFENQPINCQDKVTMGLGDYQLSHYKKILKKARKQPNTDNLIKLLLAFKENQTKLPDYFPYKKKAWFTLRNLKI